jgi:site-specific DNA-methyltransferase (adenine-specific)
MEVDTEMLDIRVGNCVELLRSVSDASIDLVLTDIPYGISLDEWDVLHDNTNSALGGRSPAQKKLGSGFKRRGKPINGWSKADLNRPKEYQDWCTSWAREVLRATKPGGSFIVFAGRRNMHRAMIAFEDAGFLVRDLLAWEKSTAHYRAQSLAKLYTRRGMDSEAIKWAGWRLGNLAPIFEPIIWLFKPYTIGGTIADNVLEHGVGAMNTDACSVGGRNPTNILRFDFAPNEKRFHEAQKPVSILDFLIRLTTPRGALVLDPFAGSGSTGVACAMNSRRFIGIEQDIKHAGVAKQRIIEAEKKTVKCELIGRPKTMCFESAENLFNSRFV